MFGFVCRFGGIWREIASGAIFFRFGAKQFQTVLQTPTQGTTAGRAELTFYYHHKDGVGHHIILDGMESKPEVFTRQNGPPSESCMQRGPQEAYTKAES